MHGGPAAALPVQQHIYPQAVGLPLGDLHVQVPLLTQSSNMSEPVPLPHCAPGPVASHAQRWKELKVDISSPCNTTKPALQRNGHCERRQSSDMAPGTGRHLDKCNCNHLPAPANASQDCSLDLLRIVKHKPSAIVFCDNDCSADNQVISSSTTEEGEDDDFPQASQYQEFLVSRQRRNLSRNRKCWRKRQEAQPHGAASGSWQKTTNKGRPEFTGSQEEEETPQNNGQQVRKTRQEQSDNKDQEVSFTVQSCLWKQFSCCMCCIALQMGL